MSTWKSVKEELPPFDTPVLVTDGTEMSVAQREDYSSWKKCGWNWQITSVRGCEWEWDLDDGYHTFVTHWMPLPLPPK
jgi:hypothetical protein